MYEAPPKNGRAYYDDEGPTAWKARVESRFEDLADRTDSLEQMAVSLKTIKALLGGLLAVGLAAAATFVITVFQDRVRLENQEQRLREHMEQGHPATTDALHELKGDVRALTVQVHTTQDAVMRRLDSLESRLSEPPAPRR